MGEDEGLPKYEYCERGDPDCRDMSCGCVDTPEYRLKYSAARIAKGLKPGSDTLVHMTPSREKCINGEEHEFDQEKGDGCTKCGMSLMAYAMMYCP